MELKFELDEVKQAISIVFRCLEREWVRILASVCIYLQFKTANKIRELKQRYVMQ